MSEKSDFIVRTKSTYLIYVLATVFFGIGVLALYFFYGNTGALVFAFVLFVLSVKMTITYSISSVNENIIVKRRLFFGQISLSERKIKVADIIKISYLKVTVNQRRVFVSLRNDKLDFASFFSEADLQRLIDYVIRENNLQQP